MNFPDEGPIIARRVTRHAQAVMMYPVTPDNDGRSRQLDRGRAAARVRIRNNLPARNDGRVNRSISRVTQL